MHRSATGAPPSPPLPPSSSSETRPAPGPSFNRSASMPPVRLLERKQAASGSASPQLLSPRGSGSRPRVWVLASPEHEPLSCSLSSPPPCAGPLSSALSSKRISSSSSSCSSTTVTSVRSPTQSPAAAKRREGSIAARLARLAGRLLVIAYYAAVLFADVDAWREREARHMAALAHRRRLYSIHGDEALYGDAAPGGGLVLPRSLAALRALLATALPGGSGGDAAAPVFPCLHVALALPCLAAMLLGLACEPAALLLACRLFADLARHHRRGLMLFWRRERVQLLRIKELAVVGATLLAASRADPGTPSTVAGAATEDPAPAVDDVLATQPSWAGASAALRLCGPRRQSSWRGSQGLASSTGGRVTSSEPEAERSCPPSPVMQQLQAQLLQVQQQQRAQQRQALARRVFWVFQRLLRHLGLALMVPLFAYYGCVQLEELRYMAAESGSGGLLAVLSEQLTATYRWVPHGDGAAETYWLPAQVTMALPFFLGLGQRWPAAALATAVGLEGALCWRFWARSGLMWTYMFHVCRHFLANAVIAAGLLSTLPGTGGHRENRTLPVGGKSGR